MEPEKRARKSGVRNPQIQRKPAKRGDRSGQPARQDKRSRQYDQATKVGLRIQRWPSEDLYRLARNFGDDMVRRFSLGSPTPTSFDEYAIRQNLAWCFLCQFGGNEPGAVRSVLRLFVLRNEHLRRLTPRERAVADGLMRGLETKEISTELKIASDTVKKHIDKMMLKAGADNRTKLVRWCLAI